MKRAHRYSVVKKPVSKTGRFSVILALISAAAFVFCILDSAIMGGEGQTYIGAIGLAAMLIALYGCVLSFKEMSRKKKGNKMLFAGAILCGVLFMVWAAAFIAGIKG